MRASSVSGPFPLAVLLPLAERKICCREKGRKEEMLVSKVANRSMSVEMGATRLIERKKGRKGGR